MTAFGDMQTPEYDARIHGDAAYVLPGFHHVSDSDKYAICTMLGSCVSACIHDPVQNRGGLNHFLLPDDPNSAAAPSRRYGVHAMEVLINDMLKRGSSKGHLVAKIFGGGKVIKTDADTSVGEKNVEFVRDFLASEEIPVVAQDVGGFNGRRIYMFPTIGKVSVLSISGAEESRISEADRSLRERVRMETKKSGVVELF